VRSSARLALIRPGLGSAGGRPYASRACMEPKALALLAGLTPPDVQVRAVDDRFEPIPYDEPWDLVALSVGTYEARRAYEIADRFRARGVPVVLGGFHPSLCPDEAQEHADVVAIGEAEGLWPTVVEDARRGALQPRYRQRRRPCLDGVLPRRDVFRGRRYAPLSVVQYGRGCNHNCEFCSIKAFYGGGLRYRPVEDVLAELAPERRQRIFFADDNIVADPDRAAALFEALIPLGRRWIGQVSLDVVDRPGLLELMARSGCQCVIVGLESLNREALRQMGKGWSRADEHARRLSAIRDHGITVYGTFVFGYDADRPGDFDVALDFAVRQRLLMANFNALQPFPGTRLYERLAREGRLIHERWWLDDDYRFGDPAFHPRGMSAAQLAEGSARARARFHGAKSILWRMLDSANLRSVSNAVLYLVANLASRHDIERKRGIALGLERGRAARDAA